VPRHPEHQLLGQRLQLVLDRAVKLLAGDPLGNLRTVVLLLVGRALCVGTRTTVIAVVTTVTAVGTPLVRTSRATLAVITLVA
jgi:hypothetical protein